MPRTKAAGEAAGDVATLPMRVGPRLKILDLFSGVGGFSLGLERAGLETAAFCEAEGFACRVLRKHWPTVPVFEDVRTLSAKRLRRHGISIEVICGGFPCQDLSTAGKGRGLDGERSGLWAHYARLIRELRPRYAIVENVAALLRRGLDRVLGDLAACGYDAEWDVIPAAAVGALHRRDRLWLVAYPHGDGRDGLVFEELARGGHLGDHRQSHLPAGGSVFGALREGTVPGWGPIHRRPVVRRIHDGIPHLLDRSAALGNAVHPRIPELIGRAILRREAGPEPIILRFPTAAPAAAAA